MSTEIKDVISWDVILGNQDPNFVKLYRLFKNSAGDTVAAAKGKNDVSILMLAAQYGIMKLAELALSKSNEIVGATNRVGDSALHLACRGGQLDLMILVQEGNASVLVENPLFQYSPFYLACRNGHLDIVEYLVSRCNDNARAQFRRQV